MVAHLTKKQGIILKLIKNYVSLKGYPPTLGEIQKELGITNKRGVVQYLEALEKKDYIKRSSKPRGIYIIDQYLSKDTPFENVPIFGYANAGEPLSFAYQDRIGSLQVDKKLIPKGDRVFALIIKGDSMSRRRINHIQLMDGNYAIISRKQEPYETDVVLAIINNCATIKSYKRSGSTIILYPESNNIVHRPIYLSEESNVFINGKIVAVLDNTSFAK